MRNINFPLTLAAVAMFVCPPALAGGGGPFVVQATASAQRGVGGDDSSTVNTAAQPPATALLAQGAGSAAATATFTQLGAAQQNAQLGESFTGRAFAGDTLTISAPGAPAGVTRLELTWRLTGDYSFTQGTSARLRFDSRYDRVGTNQSFDSAGVLELTDADAGVTDRDVTFVYDQVPVGSGWNMITTLEARSNGAVSVVNFNDTATLTGYSFFVDNAPVNAVITGGSGAVYSVPEPGVLTLVGGVGLVFWRRR